MGWLLLLGGEFEVTAQNASAESSALAKKDDILIKFPWSIKDNAMLSESIMSSVRQAQKYPPGHQLRIFHLYNVGQLASKFGLGGYERYREALLVNYPPLANKYNQISYTFLQAVEWLNRNEFDSSIRYLEKITSLPDDNSPILNLAKSYSYSQAGILWAKNANPELGVKYAIKGVEYAELAKDTFALGAAYNHLGLTYGMSGSAEGTLNYYRRAMEYFRLGKAFVRLGFIYNNAAIIYSNQGKEDSALLFINLSLRMLKTNKADSADMANAFHTKAEIFNNFNRLDSAIRYLELARKHARRGVISQDLLGYINFELGKVYRKKGQYTVSNSYLEKVLKDAELAKDKDRLQNVNYQLALNYVSMGQHQRAVDYFQAASKLAAELSAEATKRINEEYNAKFNQAKQRAELQELKLKEQQQQLELDSKQTQLQLTLLLCVILGLGLVGVFVLYRRIQRAKEVLAKQKAKIEIQNLKLEELNHTKDKLFSIIAHDLRGPIGSLKNLPDLLTYMWETSDRESLKEFSETLKRSIGSIYDLLESLLSWAKSQTGEFGFQPKNINVTSLFERVSNLYRNAAEEKQISIRTNIIDTSLYVFADEEAILTILRNLVNNAIKFSHIGGTVTLSATHNQQDSSITISVEDDGIGMNEDIQDQLFQIGKKASRQGTAGEKSTGLGMVLIKELLDNHGASIRVSSAPEKGTKMEMRFLSAGALIERLSAEEANAQVPTAIEG